MAQILPSGIKKFDPTDQVNRAAFNENWEIIDAQLAETVKKNNLAANVLDFGAKGDGVTDDTLAFQAAINTGRKVIVPFKPAGYVLSTLDLGDSVEIEGENLVSLFCANSILFRIASINCSISNFKIDMNGAPSGSTAILLNHSVKVCWFIRLNRLQFFNCHGAITDDEVSSNYVVDLQAVDCYCMYTKGVQFRIAHSRGFITFRECAVDHTYNTTPVTWQGFVFTDFIGLELEKCDVVGPVPSRVTPVHQTSQIGIYIQGTTGKASVWLTRILVDNTMGDGIYVDNVLNLFVDGLEAYQNLGSAITLKDIDIAQINNLFAMGAKGLTGAASDAPGIIFNNCKKVNVCNLISKSNNGHGVSVYNSLDNNFVNVQVEENTGFGWVESGTSNRNIVTNGRLKNNSVGTLIQEGSASVFAHWLANDIYRPHDVGSVTV